MLDSLEGRGVGVLFGGGFEEGLSCPLLIASAFSSSDPSFSYSLLSPNGVALRVEVVALLAKGAIEGPPRFLQSPVRSVEDLGLVEACDRPVPSQWGVRLSDPFQDGDQSVDSPVCSER